MRCSHKNCSIVEVYHQEYLIIMVDGVATEVGMHPDKISSGMIAVRCNDCKKNITYNKENLPKWLKKALEGASDDDE